MKFVKQSRRQLPLLALVAAGLAVLGGASWLSLQLMERLGSAPRPLTPAQRESDTPLALPPLAPDGTAPAKTFEDVPNVPTGLFNYGGGTTWSPIRGTVDVAIQAALPEFQLRYTEPPMATPGSSTGIALLLEDQLAFAQATTSLTPADFQGALQRGFRLSQIPVAIDAIVFTVHPDLPVKGLTLAQVKGIYEGQITNWRELGGPDLPITPLSRPVASGGTVTELQRQILGDRPFGGTVQFIPNTTQALRVVHRTPGAIYYGSASTIIGQCSTKPLALGRTPTTLVAPYEGSLVSPGRCPAQRNGLNREVIRSGQYPFTRRLFVVIKQNGQLDQQAGQAYANLLLSAQGQNLIQEAGFVKLH